jgi:hypothetical protein
MNILFWSSISKKRMQRSNNWLWWSHVHLPSISIENTNWLSSLLVLSISLSLSALSDHWWKCVSVCVFSVLTSLLQNGPLAIFHSWVYIALNRPFSWLWLVDHSWLGLPACTDPRPSFHFNERLWCILLLFWLFRDSIDFTLSIAWVSQLASGPRVANLYLNAPQTL